MDLIGRELSHYRITARLGAGGMGEVYRAEDLQLGRAVALKVLPQAVAGDRKRLARFRREARLLAGLDHRNIVTIYSVEADADPPFLTMELVEGGTLAEVVPRRGYGIDRFFSLAIPLVDAVAEAHAAGVVHRDLKPANVMIGKDGRIKVLDFGLAKPEEEAAWADSGSTTMHLTGEGKILGTVAYMSPEQLRGEPADARSDIFALGILLYQLATGRSPFSGSSSVDLMSSILREQPPRATEIRADLPPHLAGILRRCLQKEPDERFQSARDLRFALEGLEHELERGEAVASARQVARPLPRGLRRGWLVALAAALAGALGLWLGGRGAPAPADPAAEVQLAAPLVTWPSQESESRLSPDGVWLAFVSDRGGTPGLWIQRVEGGEAHRLLGGSAAVVSHAWSPAGDEIAALTRDEGDRRLVMVPAPLGGAPRLSLEAPSARRVVDWVGNRVYLEGGSQLLSFDLDSARWTEVAIPGDDFEFRHHYDLSDDGSQVVFSARTEGREDLWAFELDGGRARPLTSDSAKATHPRCLGSACEQVVYLSNRTGQSDVWMLDRATGSSRQLRVPAVALGIDSVAADGSLVTLLVVDEDADLWRHDLVTGGQVPLTADTLTDFWPSAARESDTVAFQRSRPSSESQSRFLDASILVARRDGAGLGDPRPLGVGGYAPLTSPDGRLVAYLRTSSAGSPPYFTELWLADVGSGRTRRISEHFQMIGYWEQPAGLLAASRAWRGAEELLYVEAGEDLAPSLVSVDTSADPPAPRRLASLEPRSRIEDLRLTPGGKVALSAKSFDSDLWELRLLGAEGEAPVLYSRSAAGEVPRLLGRRGADGPWIVSVHSSAGNLPGPVTILEVGPAGDEKPVTTIEDGLGATLSLAPGGDTVYLTVAIGDRHQLAAVALPSGALEVLVPNTLPGVTFGGIEPVVDSVLYSRQRRNADLWLLRRSAADPRDGP